MHFYKTRLLIFHTLIFLVLVNACANNHSNNYDKGIDSSLIKTIVANDTFPPGKLISRVNCASDASQSYALYIPQKGDDHPLPVVYFFDSNGDGSFPLSKYKSLADSFNFILIGSNNSKNGNDEATDENIWNQLLNDTRKRLQTNGNLIYVCGFSGGAKVATYIALHHNEVKGVIANGAGLPEITTAGNFTFSYTAIAGEGDLNMTDLVAMNYRLDQTKTNHRILFFDGIHEWAPESTMNIAFAGFKLDAMRDNAVPKDESFINNYIVASKERTDSFLQKNNYIKAERECSLSINILTGVTKNVKWFTEKETAIKNNSTYRKQEIAHQNLLTKEEAIKAFYEKQFQLGDKNYWLTTIKEVIAKSSLHNPESAMYQRLHAYLSLAFYSISNQLVKAKQDTDAAYFDELYKLSDPKNTEAWYLSAIINARNNNYENVRADLTKAVSLGFSDKNRMLQQPEFQSISSQIRLTDILNSMK